MCIAHRRDSDGVDQSLEEHLLGVAELAKRFAGKIGLESHGEVMGMLHDFGKYSNEFQMYLKSAVGLIDPDEDDYVDAEGQRGKIDHSTAGAQVVWGELSKHGHLGMITGQVLALCLASHHSGLIDCVGATDNAFGEDLFSRRMNKPEEKVHIQEARRKADDEITKRLNSLLNSPDLINGMREAFAKVIKKQPEQDDKSTGARFQFGLLARFLFSAIIDADRVDTADFEKPHVACHRQYGRYEDWDTLIDRLEKRIEQFEIRHPIDDLRRDISLHCLQAASREKGIYTLTVPTGGGKTLASLRYALHHAKRYAMERIIYVIPFTSIIDQNADVVRAILEPDNIPENKGRIVLEHHSNLTQERQGWREKILSENWDAPVIYTTMVQLLEALFGSGTRGARRMHQLANAVLIFDEVQTLPVRCIHLFNNAMNFLAEQCASSVLLCTATQPLLDRVDVKKGAIRFSESSEIMPDTTRLFADLNRVEVKNRSKAGGWRMEDISGLAMSETLRAGSCLVIVNTKKAARTIYEQCRELDEGLPLYHLSTSMCPTHRRAVLSEVRQLLDADKPVLCISTQLIEAGVDVDFGAVIRFTAGLDSIAQAAGRCNRNGAQKKGGRKVRGLVHIVNPQDENLDMLCDIRIGKDKAERVLDDYNQEPERYQNNVLGPEAMNWYYQNYFFARQDEMNYPISQRRIGHDDNILNLLSTNSLAVGEYGTRHGMQPNIYLRQAFMTAAKTFEAIDSPTQGVIVPYRDAGCELIAKLCAAFEVEKQYDLLKQAQQFSVNVSPNVLNRLIDKGALHPVQEGVGILYLEERYYSDFFGLSEEPVEKWRFNCA
ncbi:MAG: CRISPR-associated helicase Cas3' [Thermodesulfobacteriota bacterium]